MLKPEICALPFKMSGTALGNFFLALGTANSDDFLVNSNQIFKCNVDSPNVSLLPSGCILLILQISILHEGFRILHLEPFQPRAAASFF